jgi:hypothetical protein
LWGLAGQSLDQDSIKNTWEGVAQPLIAVAFAIAFRSFEECSKSVSGSAASSSKNLKK